MQQIAVYLRVSSKKQDTRSQEPDLNRWVAAFADDHTVKHYRDKQSGKTMDRPGWNRLEADIDAGRVSTPAKPPSNGSKTTRSINAT